MNTDKRILAVGKVHEDWLEVHLAPQPETKTVKESDILTDDEMQAANDDYREWQLDMDFIRRGGA